MKSSIVYLRVDRVAREVCEAAKGATVSDLHEAMAARCGLMSSRMRPLNRGIRIADPAVTAFCAPGDNLMMHRALYLSQPGDVLVVVCAAETSGAQWGDIAARYAVHKGLAGVVVQGCIRDTDTLEEMRFPVWSTAISPARPEKRGHGSVNVPVSCDGVIVNPGDLVVADGDGVLCVPRGAAADTIARARQRAAREEAFADAIRAGGHPWDFAAIGSAYSTLDVEEIDAPYDAHSR